MKDVQVSITYKMYIWPLSHILTQSSWIHWIRNSSGNRYFYSNEVTPNMFPKVNWVPETTIIIRQLQLSLATPTSILGEERRQKTETITDHAYLVTPKQWRTGSFQANKHSKGIGGHCIQNEYQGVVHSSPQGPLGSLLENYKKHYFFSN